MGGGVRMEEGAEQGQRCGVIFAARDPGSQRGSGHGLRGGVCRPLRPGGPSPGKPAGGGRFAGSGFFGGARPPVRARPQPSPQAPRMAPGEPDRKGSWSSRSLSEGGF